MNNELPDSAFQIYVRQISHYPLLTRDEERALSAAIMGGDAMAKNRMINANLRLVIKIARSFTGMGVPLMDLISEGNIGLVKAVERFDAAKGTKFSTYGSWWIRQGITRALSTQGKTIRLPVHMIDKLAKIRRVGAALSSELGREASPDEIAEEMGIDPAKLHLLLSVASRPSSLDEAIGEEETGLGERLCDPAAVNPLHELSEQSERAELTGVMDQLNDREREILSNRFGLHGGQPETLKQVGDRMGVSRERIRQIEAEAIAKLKRVYVLQHKLRLLDHPDAASEGEFHRAA
jgi:RNA polymerase primary sigma factor